MIDSVVYPFINHSLTFFLLTNVFKCQCPWLYGMNNDWFKLIIGISPTYAKDRPGEVAMRLFWEKKYTVCAGTYSGKYFPPYVKKSPPPSAFPSFQLLTLASEDLMPGTCD